MSGLGSPALRVGSPEVMNKILLRSSTPASNEKVLLYLERMQSDPPEPDDRESNPPASPRSQTVPARVTSPMLKGSNSGGSGARRSGRSELSYVTDKRQNGLGLNVMPPTEHDNEIRSDVQEGRESEVGTSVPIRTTGHVEPGPEDGPGIRYESLGSSFGNMGQPPWDQQASPNKAAGVPLPSSAPSSGSPSAFNPFQSFGMTPAMTAGVVNGRVQSPVNGSKLSQTGSKQKAPSNRAKSPVNDADRSLSPRSGVPSQGPSRVTQKTSRGTDVGTRHPPLPDSRADSRAESRAEELQQESEVGPLPPFTPGRSKSQGGHGHSRAPSKVSTLAPSDSPSVAGLKYYKKRAARLEQELQEKEQAVAAVQMKSPKSQGQPVPNPMSPKSPTVRAMSPRQVTQEDLMQVTSALSPRMLPQTNGHGHSHISGTNGHQYHEEQTPVQSRTQSQVDDELDEEEEEMVRTILSKTPRTSMAPSALEPDVQNSHFHDMELCELLHSLEAPNLPEVVKKAVRKAVRARVKKLGMKSDNESIRQYRKSFHDHDPRVHLQDNFIPELSDRSEPPDWARELMQGMLAMQQRLDHMAPKIERMKLSRTGSVIASKHQIPPSALDDGGQGYMNGFGTIADESVYQPDTGIMDPTTVPGSTHEESIRDEEEYGDGEDEEPHQYLQQEMLASPRGLADEYMLGGRNDSPGRQFLEEELYKLRVKTGPGSAVGTHKTWEVAREDGDFDYEGDAQAAVTDSGMPDIPDATVRQPSPSLPPVPQSEGGGEMVHMPEAHWTQGYGSEVQQQTPPWQLIHQRLLNWAIIWPMSELDAALGSTTRGHQVDEISLSIWATQSYKRYVRSRMTDSPQGRVDRLFVPPNVADAISTAVFNGRHGDACMMLRDLWAPFGLDGIPRLLIVLAKHRADSNHWVVHRFSLPDGQLTTYDTYPDKCLPDGRPLGWWFAIRIAWPDANYPSPDNLMQKMVRLHRPLQLGIDNSVAAAGIWRNLLMGSRAERSVDLERLRDLINTEVKNLRQRKLMGKLSIGQPKPNWDDMN